MKYLRKFENIAAYNVATLFRPSVSLIESTSEVIYNPIQPAPEIPERRKPLRFTAIGTPITISFDASGLSSNEGGYGEIYYRLGDESTISSTEFEDWVIDEYWMTESLTLNPGDCIEIAGDLSIYDQGEFERIGKFYFTEERHQIGRHGIEASGNLGSLVGGEDFDWETGLLSDTFELDDGEVFNSLFENCDLLLTSPLIPETTGNSFQCYNYLFKGCSNLTSIKTEFTSWGTRTTGWVDGVSSSGNFICSDELLNEGITYGIDRIPSGWTINGESL